MLTLEQIFNKPRRDITRHDINRVIDKKGRYERLIDVGEERGDCWSSKYGSFTRSQEQTLTTIQLELICRGYYCNLNQAEDYWSSYCTDVHYANWIEYTGELDEEYTERYFLAIEVKKRKQEHALANLAEAAQRSHLLNQFQLNIDWVSEINDIDLLVLRTEIDSGLLKQFPDSYYIVFLPLSEVINLVVSDSYGSFSAKDLIGERKPSDMGALIEMVQAKKKLIPPMITFVLENKISIMDGRHRIALANCMDVEEIPFIVEKSELEQFRIVFNLEQ